MQYQISRITNTSEYINFLKVSDLNTWNKIKISNFCISKEIAENKYNIFCSNSIIFAKVGEACKLNRKILIKSKKYLFDNNLSGLFLIDEKNMSIEYFFYLISKINFKKFVVDGNLPTISTKDILNLSINIPSFLEQQKIAQFFTLLDHHIKLWERKLELCQLKLNFHVNKIFSKNKSSKDVSLKDFIVLKKIKVNDLKIDVATVSNKYGIMNQKKYFLDRNVASENINNYYIIEEKWFGYNPARINVGSIGLNNSGIKMCLSPMYIIFSSKIKEEILEYFFKSNYFNQEIKKMLVGSVRNSLKFNDLIKVKFIKEDIKTLEKKATFLKVLNDNIKNISYYIEELKNRKKYYLNNIFI